MCFESGAKGSCGIASQRKRCFGVLPMGFGKSLIFQLFVLAKKQSFQLTKCFSRTINKINRPNTTPTVHAICTYICRFFFGLSTFLSLHSCLWRRQTLPLKLESLELRTGELVQQQVSESPAAGWSWVVFETVKLGDGCVADLDTFGGVLDNDTVDGVLDPATETDDS